MNVLIRSLVWILLSLLVQRTIAQAAEPLKVGFISTFSGGGALLGQHMYDGFMLGLGQRGGKLGGVTTQIIKGDDQLKPEIALKLARDMIQGEKVNFLVGFVFSNVLLAASKVGIDSETFVISANAGPAELAGKSCSPYFFAVAYQNEMNDEGAGTHFSQSGFKKVYLMAPNYVAGREALSGFKRTFKGEIVGEVYTALDQVDYSAELAQMRAAKPDAAYVFYPGGLGVMFV
jgi:branched-chain amino acid transport system substrate-binding protein